MKLSKTTIEILKNFSEINPSMYFVSGREQSTLAPSKKIYAEAILEESFDKNFGVYELSKVLSAVSITKEPEVTLTEKSIVLSGEKSKFEIIFCSPDSITHAAGKKIPLPSADVSFDLTAAALQEIDKAAKVLGLPNIVFDAGNGAVTMIAMDNKNQSSHSYSAHLTEYDGDPLRLVFNANVFRFLPGSYKVEMSSRHIARFTGDKVTYMVVAEAPKSND